MSVGVRIHADGALASLRAARTAARTAVPRAVARSGAYAVTVVRSNASTGTHAPGRPHIPGTGPGPNVATGDLRRSITATNHTTDGVAISDVSTAAVQAARLEYGFIGRDAAGRFYRAPAYPYFEPATAQVEVFAEAEAVKAAAVIEAAFGGEGGGN